jgi:hypothetical protein
MEGEHFSNEEEYRDYLDWKKRKEAPVPKPGDLVVVPRSDGSVDQEGWKIKFLYPDDDGIMIAAVEDESRGLKKDIPLSELVEYNTPE